MVLYSFKEVKMLRIVLVCTFFCSVVINCVKTVNPPDKVLPSVTIQSDGSYKDGDTIPKETIIFNWVGDGKINEFCYRIDSTEWSLWSDIVKTTSATLDDGNHTFEVRTRYKEELDVVVKKFSFIVDALKSPSVAVSPCFSTITKDTVTLGIVTDGVLGCKALHIKLSGVKVLMPKANTTDSTKPGLICDSNEVFTLVSPDAASITSNGLVFTFQAVLVPNQKETEVKIVECTAFNSTDSSSIKLLFKRSGIVIRK